MILDESYLNELRELAGDELNVIVELFLESLDERMIALRQSAEDAKSLAETAHSIKGSAGNVGATALSKLVGEIESSAKKGDLDLARSYFPGLEEIYQETLLAYKNLGFSLPIGGED